MPSEPAEDVLEHLLNSSSTGLRSVSSPSHRLHINDRKSHEKSRSPSTPASPSYSSRKRSIIIRYLLLGCVLIVAVLGLLRPYSTELLNTQNTSPFPFHVSRNGNGWTFNTWQSYKTPLEYRDNAAQAQHEVLVATNNSLLWYNITIGKVSQVSVNQSYQAVFRGDRPPQLHGGCPSLWVALSNGVSQQVAEIEAETGHSYQVINMTSSNINNMVRSAEHVYITSKGRSWFYQYELPSMHLIRQVDMFLPNQTIESMALVDENDMWVLLNNLDVNSLVQLDLAYDPPLSIAHIDSVGSNLEGLVVWKGSFLILDTIQARLLSLDPRTKKVQELWKSPEHAYGVRLHGLAVLDQVAYVGVHDGQPNSTYQTNLLAFNLTSNQVLWQRQVGEFGAVTSLSAPQLGAESNYRAMYTVDGQGSSKDAWIGPLKSVPIEFGGQEIARLDKRLSAAFHWARHKSGFPPVIGGHWSNGRPYMDLTTKASIQPWKAGLLLPVTFLDLARVQVRPYGIGPSHFAVLWKPEHAAKHSTRLINHPESSNWDAKGVTVLPFLASDSQGLTIYVLPYFHVMKVQLFKVMTMMIGSADVQRVVWMDLVRLNPGTNITINNKPGRLAKVSHHLHMMISGTPGVSVQVCPRYGGLHATQPNNQAAPCVRAPIQPGLVLEINNRVPYQVSNMGKTQSLHLVMEVTNKNPRERLQLNPGNNCTYLDTGRFDCSTSDSTDFLPSPPPPIAVAQGTSQKESQDCVKEKGCPGANEAAQTEASRTGTEDSSIKETGIAEAYIADAETADTHTTKAVGNAGSSSGDNETADTDTTESKNGAVGTTEGTRDTNTAEATDIQATEPIDHHPNKMGTANNHAIRIAGMHTAEIVTANVATTVGIQAG